MNLEGRKKRKGKNCFFLDDNAYPKLGAPANGNKDFEGLSASIYGYGGFATGSYKKSEFAERRMFALVSPL